MFLILILSRALPIRYFSNETQTVTRCLKRKLTLIHYIIILSSIQSSIIPPIYQPITKYIEYYKTE